MNKQRVKTGFFQTAKNFKPAWMVQQEKINKAKQSDWYMNRQFEKALERDL